MKVSGWKNGKRGGMALLAVGLVALSAWPKTQADTLCNADDLRGTWVYTFTRIIGTTANTVFYLQVSMGGTATNSNKTVVVLSGGTLQETPTRALIGGGGGGSVTVEPDGEVTATFNLVNDNAQTSTIQCHSGDGGGGLNGSADRSINYLKATTAGAPTIRRGLQSDKNTMPNQRDDGTTPGTATLSGSNLPTGTPIGSTALDSAAAGSYGSGSGGIGGQNAFWTATKISDNEVTDGNTAGQGCFLRTARR